MNNPDPAQIYPHARGGHVLILAVLGRWDGAHTVHFRWVGSRAVTALEGEAFRREVGKYLGKPLEKYKALGMVADIDEVCARYRRRL